MDEVWHWGRGQDKGEGHPHSQPIHNLPVSVMCHCVVTVSISDRGDSSTGYIIRLTSLQCEEIGGGVIKVRGGLSR